jgi:hypothetical protein
LITHADDPDEGREGLDDGLAALLHPDPVLLAPPDGSFERIRRTAARRRTVRAAVGGGLTLALAAAVAWPVYLAAVPRPPVPVRPAAPPAASTPSPTAPRSARPTPRPQRPTAPAGGRGRTAAPSSEPRRDGRTARRPEPTAVPGGTRSPVPSTSPSRAGYFLKP